jgi:hypothetical protein
VPCFALPALHERLMAVPEFAQGARLTHGHGQLIGELTSAPTPAKK